MKCPYCAEEIEDAAVVCKHCRRDFAVFAGVLRESRESARQLATLKTEREKLLESVRRFEEASATGTTWRPSTLWTCVYTFVISTALSTVAYGLWIRSQEQLNVRTAAAVVYALAPVVVSGWLGIGLPGFHVFAYFATGGLSGLCIYWLSRAFTAEGGVSGVTLWGSVFWGVCAIFTGALIGDWIERLTSPDKHKSHFFRVPATYLVNRFNRNVADFHVTVGNIAKLLAAVTGLLTAIAGTIAAMYNLSPRR